MDNFYERFPEIIKNNPLVGELESRIWEIPGVEGVYRDESFIGYLTDSVVRFEDRDDSRATINSISPELI